MRPVTAFSFLVLALTALTALPGASDELRVELRPESTTIEFTLEATIRSETLEPERSGESAGIVTLSNAREGASFAFSQWGDLLMIRLRTSLTGPLGSEPMSLGRPSTREPVHVIVSYRPGRWSAT